VYHTVNEYTIAANDLVSQKMAGQEESTPWASVYSYTRQNQALAPGTLGHNSPLGIIIITILTIKRPLKSVINFVRLHVVIWTKQPRYRCAKRLCNVINGQS
jgi:hypothetical protein